MAGSSLARSSCWPPPFRPKHTCTRTCKPVLKASGSKPLARCAAVAIRCVCAPGDSTMRSSRTTLGAGRGGGGWGGDEGVASPPHGGHGRPASQYPPTHRPMSAHASCLAGAPAVEPGPGPAGSGPEAAAVGLDPAMHPRCADDLRVRTGTLDVHCGATCSRMLQTNEQDVPSSLLCQMQVQCHEPAPRATYVLQTIRQTTICKRYAQARTKATSGN